MTAERCSSRIQGVLQAMGKHRWTIMVIPHGSEALHSLGVSARAARAAAWGVVLVAIVLVVGLRAIVTQASRLLSADATPVSSAAPPADPDALADLRSRLARLDSVLDTIRSADRRLRDAVGTTPVRDSALLLRRARASTDSLLGHAATVVMGFGSLADSAAEAERRRARAAPIPASRAR